MTFILFIDSDSVRTASGHCPSVFYLSLYSTMRKNKFYQGVLVLCLLCSCGGGHNGHDHDEHNEHATEETHAHEGHNHEEHEDHDHESHHHEAEAAGHGSGGDEIVLSPEKAKAAGVKVETVEPGEFRQVILTSGEVLAAQGDEATVVASTAGVVHFPTRLTEGASLSKGTPVVHLLTASLQDGDQVQRARMAFETARAEYERAKRLAEKQIVSQKELARLKEASETARLAYEALSPSTDGKAVAVKSPIGGYVKTCYVKEGDYVSVGQPLLEVTQSRRLQLKAYVSERYYSSLRHIRSAHFRTASSATVFQLDSLNGRLLSYGKASADAAFHVPVVFEFDNRGELLPGAFAEVWLLSEPRTGVISVPTSALTEEQGLHFVYLQEDAECYRKQEVRTGATDGCRTEILSGLKPGDRLVTQGAMHVRLAAASNAIPAHSHNH